MERPLLGLYPHNMKAICGGGIPECARPEEINRKGEHNDGASEKVQHYACCGPQPLLTMSDNKLNEKSHLYSTRKSVIQCR